MKSVTSINLNNLFMYEANQLKDWNDFCVFYLCSSSAQSVKLHGKTFCMSFDVCARRMRLQKQMLKNAFTFFKKTIAWQKMVFALMKAI